MNIKNPAFIGALGLIALVLGLTGWYMATHPAPVPPTQQLPVTALEIDTPKHATESGTYTAISVTYPTKIVFPLSSRSDAGSAAERAMKAWVDQAVAEFKGYAKENEASINEFIAAGEEPPASLSSMRLTIDYEKKTGPRTLTYLFTSASYTGGAHGIEVPVTFTFDRTTGAQVTLSDLFLPGYLARLSDIARAELPGIMGDYANPDFIEDGTTPRAENFETFYLEGERIVFLFPPYQVAPYAAGTVELAIELSRLSDVLRPEYLPIMREAL